MHKSVSFATAGADTTACIRFSGGVRKLPVIFAISCFCVFTSFGDGEKSHADAIQTDGEIWNLGVEFYRDGDSTNALRVLRPLLLSKTHGARAAELIAALAHKSARDANVQNPLELREEAANAAQIASRANPDDARLSRNLTRALDGLPELRETARINAALEKAKDQDAGALLLTGVREMRDAMKESLTLRTNEASVVIARADALSARVEKLADSWYAVKQTVCASVTNEEQQATISLQVDDARMKTEKASVALGDLAEDSYSLVADAEIDFTRFLKAVIDPPNAMREDLVAQSNVIEKVETINNRNWQSEALDFTRAFRVRFPMWAKAYEQQAAANTNMAPFTAEMQSKVSALSTRLESLQNECVEKPERKKEEECAEIIRKILELLPNKGGGGGNKADKNQNPEQNKQQEQKQDSSGENDKNENGNQEENQNQDDGSDDSKDEKDAGEEEKDSQQPEDKEVDSVLRKAQERSDEHEAEKRLRMRKAPLPPNSRDW